MTSDSRKALRNNAGLAALVTVVTPVMAMMMAGSLRRSFSPDDPAVLLWWADPLNDATLAAMGMAGMGAIVVAILILARPDIAWWKIARLFWAGAGLLGLAAIALSFRAEVRVYPDRIVTVAMDGSRSAVSMGDAKEIEVWCDVLGRRRSSDIPTIGYTIHFPDQSISLRSAMGGRSKGAARAWFHKVETLDREVLASVPHAPYGPAHDVTCVRSLRTELGEADFTAARRMLGITDADFARYYAEPHEAWSEGRRDGR
jgi:hypothetical protein